MNIVLLVIDSLRQISLEGPPATRPATPFFDRLATETTAFRRAYATECWTLPTHLSMFTGQLPSEHRAHFQTMAYRGGAPTIAELLARRGFHTEVITRNSLFDGTVPGATRGFMRNTRVLAEPRHGAALFALVLALAKPRVRRLIRTSGFFHTLQKDDGGFLRTLVRMGLPADELLLERALATMDDMRRHRRPYFLFLNLYDVHAPYSPEGDSPLRPWRSVANVAENLTLPFVLPRISSHAYLKAGFRLSARSRRLLLDRYHRAIELMDAKVERFFSEAMRSRLLEDTALIITADHGEAFGEHGLYFHDASVRETHLRVPLWIRHPAVAPAVVDDVVSMRDLFGLIRAIALDEGSRGTVLDAEARRASPVALAEHFHYPDVRDVLERFRHNQAAAIIGTRKITAGYEGFAVYDLERDPGEECPEMWSARDLDQLYRVSDVPASAASTAVAHVARWGSLASAA